MRRNPASTHGFRPAIPGAGYPLPGGHDDIEGNIDKVESKASTAAIEQKAAEAQIKLCYMTYYF